jgi:hypothetical protein
MKVSHLRIMFIIVCVLTLAGSFTADAQRSGSEVESSTKGQGFMMAKSYVEEAVCNAPIPNLLDAVPGDRQITITWSDEHAGDAAVTGYNIYYDKDGKSQPVTSVWPRTTYTNTGLTNGQEYCYKVTALYAECESVFSNVKCAVPAEQGSKE